MKSAVLIVDDDEVIRRLLRVNLELEGFDVLEAKDAVEGYEIITKARPAAVVLDIMMPGVTGLDLLGEVRSHPELRGVSIILATARCRDSDVWNGWCAGADSYVTKPFDLDLLVSEVHRVSGIETRRDTEFPASVPVALVAT